MIEPVKSKSSVRSITTRCRNIAASQVFTPRRKIGRYIAIMAPLEALSASVVYIGRFMSISDKRRAFRALHQSGCFVIPNPWNIGSARYLQGLGFKALATTSAGPAHAQGFADGAQSRDDVLAHYRELAA